MHSLFALPFLLLGVNSTASSAMHSFVSPVINAFCAIGSVACVFFLVNGGFVYLTSSGKPENANHAKRIIRNALLGLILIFAANAVTQILSHAYTDAAIAAHSNVPNLTPINPAPVSNGLVSVIIKAITGVLDDIVRSLAAPFINSLSFFTKSTPLMADNPTVFNLWVAMVGISDSLFVLVVSLLGFRIMSMSAFGFDEIEFKHLLPRLALLFLVINSSIFVIDGVIELSNAMVNAINLTGGTKSLWDALSSISKQSPQLSLSSLLIMLLFTIFAVILVIYYLGRLITLYIGAILSPIIVLIWAIPGFRDFSETAAKTYVTTIFVLFVQVVILIVSGSLIASTTVDGANQVNFTLMPMITGVAAMYAVLKVPSVMTKLSFVSVGPRSARQLGGQLLNGVNYMTRRDKEFIQPMIREGNNKNFSTPYKSITERDMGNARPSKPANRSNLNKLTKTEESKREVK